MKKFLFLILLLYPLLGYSQLKLNVKVSASNLLRYGNGKETLVGSTGKKEYFEELGEARLFVNDFIFGVRYEYDDPIEFGTSVKGISRRYLEFTKDNFLVRAGNFYELFEKGLTLNAFENRGLGFNTQVDGIKLNYKTDIKKVRITGTVEGGTIDYNDYLKPGRVEKYSIRAVNFSVKPFKPIMVGGSYLYTKGNIPSGNITTDITAEIAEGDLSLNIKSLDLFVSYANKKTITIPNQLYPNFLTPRGDGLYSSLSYSRANLGVTLEYKNYRFDLVTPNERSNTRPTKALPFQSPPTVVREHTSTLLSRFPHIVDFNDEVGYEADIFYSPKDNLTFNLNFSQASRHYDYVDIDTTLLTKYQRVERNAFLPSMLDAFSPFWEVFLEAEYYYKKNIKIKLGAARQYSVLYNNANPSASDLTKTYTFPLEIKYDFLKKYSLKLNGEFQSVYNTLRTGKKEFISEYVSLALSRSPDIVIVGNTEFTSDLEDPSGKKFWINGELTYKFSSANTMILYYGSERGGLKCSSGICRYVNPFNGFRLTVINNFN